MAERVQAFVAEDLWLLIAVVTLALIGLAGIAGLGTIAGAISVVGWFLLTPIFLFWGEDIASWLFEAGSEPDRSGASDDPIEALKRRYAEGEIDEEEFERRLDRLLTVDDALDRAFSPDQEGRDAGQSDLSGTGDGADERTTRADARREREFDR